MMLVFPSLRLSYLLFVTAFVIAFAGNADARRLSDPTGYGDIDSYPLRHIAFMTIDGASLVETPNEWFVEQSPITVTSYSFYTMHQYMGPSAFAFAGFEIVLPDSTTNIFYVLIDNENNQSYVVNGDEIYSSLPAVLYVNTAGKSVDVTTKIYSGGYSDANDSVSSSSYHIVSLAGSDLGEPFWTQLKFVCDWEQYEDGDISYSQSMGRLFEDQFMLVTIVPIANSDSCGTTVDIKTKFRSFYWGDLDVDSDNDDGYSIADRSVQEDRVENLSDNQGVGKIIGVNIFDEDDDLIPDFADGYDLEPTEPDSLLATSLFTPLHLELPGGVNHSNIRIKFLYPASDPFNVSVVDDSTSTPNKPTRILQRIHTVTSGHLRIWTKDGNETRNGNSIVHAGDFIPNDVELSPSELGIAATESGVTLFIEAVDASPSSINHSSQIGFALSINSGIDYQVVDTVKVTAIESSVVVDSEHEFGFDDYTYKQEPWISAKAGESFSAFVSMSPPLDLQNDASVFFVPRDTSVATADENTVFQASTEKVSITGLGAERGETIIDLLAGISGSANNIGRSVEVGHVRVATYPENEISLAVIPIHLPQQGGGYLIPPSIDEALFEQFLNTVVYNQCGIKVNVTLIPPKIVDYDYFFPDDKFTLSRGNSGLSFPVNWNYKEQEIVVELAKEVNYDYNMFIVHDATTPDAGGGLPMVSDFVGVTLADDTMYSFLNGAYFNTFYYPQSAAHELGHGLNLGHPVEEQDPDPYNLLNYGYLDHKNSSMYRLRKYQWDIAWDASLQSAPQ